MSYRLIELVNHERLPAPPVVSLDAIEFYNLSLGEPYEAERFVVRVPLSGDGKEVLQGVYDTFRFWEGETATATPKVFAYLDEATALALIALPAIRERLGPLSFGIPLGGLVDFVLGPVGVSVVVLREVDA